MSDTSSPHQVVHSDGAPRAIGPYSQAIAAGDWIFSAGQLGLDPATGELVDGGVQEQTRRALENIKAVLEAAGASLRDVVKATIYVVDLGDYKLVNALWAEYFPVAPPARTTVQVAALPRGGLIEFDVVAHRQG
ncbi:MAG: RidA family protein [Proteobacteria bacterium]|nr:RidA family protein [Pseudomonadota bacterium]